mmetsp:Transcript_9987/g.12946  ORF Transcript_9987/g.12946 Transcript_9987/m.12946 type:complete len:113 (-) Transcript_9987:636-974(-)
MLYMNQLHTDLFPKGTSSKASLNCGRQNLQQGKTAETPIDSTSKNKHIMELQTSMNFLRVDTTPMASSPRRVTFSNNIDVHHDFNFSSPKNQTFQKLESVNAGVSPKKKTTL